MAIRETTGARKARNCISIRVQGRWGNPDPSHLAHHIGIAVAYNVWQFYQASADLAYLDRLRHRDVGRRIARFWVSRATYDKQERDRYDIYGVIGPDEFHSGYPNRPFQGIDNNAYTNVMAVWVILRALDALELMPLPNRLDIREKLNLTSAEGLAQWDHVEPADVHALFHDGVISQFEGYENLAELDPDEYRRRYGNMQRLDRILEAQENDDVNRYKASKQADVLMLLYLIFVRRIGGVARPPRLPVPAQANPDDGRLFPRPHVAWFDTEWRRVTLGCSPEPIAIGRWEFFQEVLKSDVADIQGGTTCEGIHLAAMAGSVDLCAAMLHRPRDTPARSPRVRVGAPIGQESLERTWLSAALPRAPPARAGQRKRRRGCERRPSRRSARGHRMSRPGRRARAGKHDSFPLTASRAEVDT